MAIHYWTHGDTGRFIDIYCLDRDGDAPDLSAATLNIEVFRIGQPTSILLSGTPVDQGEADLNGTTYRKVRYTFVAGDSTTIPNRSEEYHVHLRATSGGVSNSYPGTDYDTLDVTADPQGVPDDLGTVSYLTAAESAAAYERRFMHNVVTYGALGDGVTDDTAAVLAAYTAAAAVGGIVYFPAGTYIAESLDGSAGTIFTITSPNVTFRGAGRKASIVKSSSLMAAGHKLFLVDGTSRIVFEDLGVQATNSSNSSKAICFEGATDCTVNRVWADAQFGWSVFIGDIGDGSERVIVRELESAGTSSSHNIEINNSSYTLVDGCDITFTSGNGLELYENGGAIVGNTIRDNWFHGTGASGVQSFGSVDTLIEGNIIEGGTTAGIYASNSGVTPATSGSGLVIRGNRVRSVASGAGGGIYVSNSGGGTGPTDVTIEDNRVTGCGGAVAGIVVFGTGAMRAAVNGNASTLNGGAGIAVEGVHVSVIGNVVMNNSQTGVSSANGISIGASTATPDAIVIGNECSDTQATHTQQFGIYIGPSSTDAVVIGNKAMGTTSFAVYDVGTSTVKHANRQDFAGASKLPNVVTSANVGARSTVTYSPSMTGNAWNGNVFTVTITNGTAHTFNAPSNLTTGQRWTAVFRNTSGGAAGALTFGSGIKAAAWTQAATGFSRSITFEYDGTDSIEVSRTAADVPN